MAADRPKLRIATCLSLPEPDPDEAPLRAALAAAGIDASLAGWDDPSVDWDAPIPTVIRSTWNYFHDRPGFLAWAARAARAAPLWNGPAIVAWNSHKGYLGELARRGHAVMPTLFVARGRAPAPGELTEELARLGFGGAAVVVKPTVSAGSFATRHFAAGDVDAAQAFLAAESSARDMLVQPFLASVAGSGPRDGERSLVFVDGVVTHAMRKAPRFADGAEAVTGPWPIADDELALADAVLAPYRAELLYARVDMARDHAGRPMLMELELIEPSLFLAQHRPALDRLVRALGHRLGLHSPTPVPSQGR